MHSAGERKRVMVLVNRERLVNTFLELVKIDSETGEEKMISEVLKRKFAALGLTVEEDDAKAATGHAANNLICTLPGNAPGTPIYFGLHMDTVFPGRNVTPSVSDGWIASDGRTILGADDKAGLSAVLEALKVIREKKLFHPDVQAVVTVGEEAGLLGAKALDTSLVKAEYGFVLDSDGPVGDIITEAPYLTKLAVSLFGRTSHAGIAPEKGISAITMAAKAIARMPLGRIDSETTANIGRFKGGRASHVVCDYVRVLAEARSLTRAKMETQVKKMTGSFVKTAEEMNGKAVVQANLIYPGYRFGENDAIVQIAAKAAAAIGRTPHLLSSGGGSDANVICEKGIPTVNLGVGYEKIHTTEERIPVTELEKTGELVLSLIRQVTGRPFDR